STGEHSDDATVSVEGKAHVRTPRARSRSSTGSPHFHARNGFAFAGDRRGAADAVESHARARRAGPPRQSSPLNPHATVIVSRPTQDHRAFHIVAVVGWRRRRNRGSRTEAPDSVAAPRREASGTTTTMGS